MIRIFGVATTIVQILSFRKTPIPAKNYCGETSHGACKWGVFVLLKTGDPHEQIGNAQLLAKTTAGHG